MSRFRLRYQATDIELPEGEFVIGRSSSCSLALDDSLVSRRHAMLVVDSGGVTARDLGSRNGILVNGVQVEGARSLRHLDRVSIGSQDLVLIELDRKARPTGTRETRLCGSCGRAAGGDELRCSRCGHPLPRMAVTMSGVTLEMKVPVTADPEEVTRQATGFELLAGIAAKALALKRFDEAERILARHLDNMLAHSEAGSPPSPAVLAEATPFALSLCEGLGEAGWMDWVFRIHRATRQMLTLETVDRLHELARVVGHSDARALREYLGVLKDRRSSLTHAERFVLSRLESLERVISA